jgi:hypothetical protein
MVDLLLAGAAVALLLIVTVVLLRGERPSRARLAAAVAVIVVAAGAFAVALYHHQTAPKTTSTDLPNAPLPAPASEGLGAAVHTVEVPMGAGDKLPQGALRLNPARAGTDPYTGDLSLLCSTPGKADHDQNCTGTDRRVWSIEPLKKLAVVTANCEGADFQPGYLELAEGHTYCARLTADPATTFTLRIPKFPADQPLPTKIVVEVSDFPG